VPKIQRRGYPHATQVADSGPDDTNATVLRLTTTSKDPRVNQGERNHPAAHGCSDDLHIEARLIQPGDFLPPQRALHGTRYREVGFAVGGEGRDVVSGVAGLAGRMLLYGPAGVLDAVDVDSEVAVRRRKAARPA
jgi:hypothetical protein